MKLTIDSIQYINLFEQLTKTNVKGFFPNSHLIFIVQEGHISRAIGKNGINVKRIEELIRKKIKIVEYSKDPLIFVKNLILPLKIKKISVYDNNIEVNADTGAKALLIGRNSQNLIHLNNIIKNYFNLTLKIK